MEQAHPFKFKKSERLCSKRLIDDLFDGKGKSMSVFPIRVVYKVIPKEEHIAPTSILISVSKRRFKRAVKRNQVKRQIREAYRMNKDLLSDVLTEHPEENLLIGFLWLSDKLYSSKEVESCVRQLLGRIAGHLNEK
ncbi:MAG: ribonuclease P protein component [Paraprevotella sp.]|jgi:ribonuclease P protein component|nr:ribonuclease P protein component [Paraprevotella sp.]